MMDKLLGANQDKQARVYMLIQSLTLSEIDQRLLNKLRSKLLELSKDGGPTCSLSDFFSERKALFKEFPSKVDEYLMPEIMESGQISISKFSEIIDLYKYLPIPVKKDRNLSIGVKQALNPYKKSEHGKQQRLLSTLGAKLEERFIT